MIEVIIAQRNGEKRSEVFAKAEISIGSARENDLTLPGPAVTGRHARLVHKDDQLILIDLRSDGGTFVNGLPIRAPHVVKLQDTIRIGPYTLFAHVP